MTFSRPPRTEADIEQASVLRTLAAAYHSARDLAVRWDEVPWEPSFAALGPRQRRRQRLCAFTPDISQTPLATA